MTVYEKLRHLVVSGALSPTQRVSESRLAELLDVSRTPIREALQRLDGDGLVHSQGRGVRVRILTSDELLHLHDARAGLEGWALATVARRVADGLVPPADLAALRVQADLTHQLTTSGDFDRAVQANRDLHEQAAALAGNPVITQTLRHWWDQIIISTRLSLHSSTRVHEVNAEHLAILNALEAGDVEAARLATETHCRATSDILAAPPSS